MEDDAFDEVEAGPIIECTPESDDMNERRILEMDAERALFADGPVVEIIPDGGSLVPTLSHLVYSPRDSRVLVQHSDEQGKGNAAFRIEPRSEVINLEERYSGSANVNDHSPNAYRSHLSDLEEPTRVGAAWGSAQFSASPTMGNEERRYAFGNGFFTRSNVIKLVKALAVVVLALLAIEVIVYLYSFPAAVVVAG